MSVESQSLHGSVTLPCILFVFFTPRETDVQKNDLLFALGFCVLRYYCSACDYEDGE